MRRVTLTEQDRFIYEHEIRPFLPERLFDAHAHLLRCECHLHLDEELPLTRDPALAPVDLAYLEEWWRALFPDAEVQGLVMGTPTKSGDVEAENRFVAEEVQDTGNRFSILVRPQTPVENLEATIRQLRPAGLKPYMAFTGLDAPNEAGITDLIPEAQLALANEHRLAVTLHVAKPGGMADANNLDDIGRLVRDFPQCAFILAHCGRCFIAPNMETALERLPVAENLWIDTSAVCDLGVFLHLFQRYDRTRVLFGTDLVTATGFRGTYARLGLSWHVCTQGMVSGLEPKATFAAYENLAALLRAARFCGWSEAAIRDLFHENAGRLFGLKAAQSGAGETP